MLLLGLQFIDGRSNDLPGDSLIGIYSEVYPDNQRIPITPCCASLGELSCWCRKLTCHKPGWEWLHKELWELHHFAEYILPKAEAGEIAPGQLTFDRCLDQDKIERLFLETLWGPSQVA